MIFEQHLSRAAIPEIRKLQPRARDNIFVCDAGGLADRLGKIRLFGDEEYRRGLIGGDLSRVEESSKFLEQLEEQIPVSRTFANVAEVTGSLPIVPALLAGHPQAMRLRRRVRRPMGPLSIFLESTGSGGIREGEADSRGAAMLALARKLAETRPVDLWVCVTYGERNLMCGLLCKIETTPLDLGRATHMLANLYQTAVAGRAVFNDAGLRWDHGWSYGSTDLERRWCGEIFRRFLNPSSDVLYVPAAHLRDNFAQPVEWLKKMLVEYGGETIEGYQRKQEDE
jgi:hypothetical protein